MAASAKKYKSGVQVITIVPGNGAKPKKGDKLSMHYIGRFYGGSKNGQQFDSSLDNKGKPFQFKIGVGEVIKGWDEGVMQMKLGEKAILEISWDYAYGEDGYQNVIPARQDLQFEVELLKIN